MSEAFMGRRGAFGAAAEAAVDALKSGRAVREPRLLRSPQDVLHIHDVPRWTRLMLALAPRISHGSLTLTLPDGRAFVAQGTNPGPAATVHICHHRFARRLLTGGNLAVGQAYIDGDFECDDLAALTTWACRNSELDSTLMGKPWLRLLRRIGFVLARNNKRGARRNIAYHYDLGNEFYAAWLDPSMTYSSALWREADEDIETAQMNKYRRLAGDVLQLRPGQRVLEIGCGWGSFAGLAAREYGVQVHAVTISREQHDHTRRRIQEQGLNDRVSVELRDYRDLTGQYDAIASIEMIEAVGEKYWPVYFGQLRDRLLPQGRIGLQVITIDDKYFDDYRGTMDFIQAYIFPGGMLLSPAIIAGEARAAGLDIVDEFGFGSDYARTLELWHQRFETAWPSIRAQGNGFDERFRRMWRYYLAYCEGGFRAGTIDVRHYGLTRAG